MQQGGQHHAETEPGVELDGLGVVCGGGAREAGPQCRQDVGQTVPLPHHEHGDEQRQGEARTGARYGARCVLTRVGALRRQHRVKVINARKQLYIHNDCAANSNMC